MSTQTINESVMSEIYDIEMASITGEPVAFSQFKDKVWLAVNVASQ